MSNGSRRALGRRLDDLLHGARPPRVIERAASPVPGPDSPSDPAAAASATSAEMATGADARPVSISSPTGAGPTPPPEPPAAPSVSSGSTATPPAASSPPPRRRAPFGPELSYQTPADPDGLRAGSELPVLLIIDAILLVSAGVLAFTPLVPRPLSLILALVAVVLGALVGCLAFVLAAQRRQRRATTGKPSRVRVHLTRV